jgi:asparagine synthase (glutamine-hydrolysing)
MCGIGGLFLRQPDALDIDGALLRMLDIQHHRGPDGRGLWQSSTTPVGLCHNRLAILDVSSSGAQPMHTPDGRNSVVFNGEIYNYLELRRELTVAGYTFSSGSDTEVLLTAYCAWGEHMLARLKGMFAFAIFDAEKNTLFCARDRVGKKPFVYAETRDGFLFASEIPAIAAIPGVGSGLDHDALASMLLHNMRHVPDPGTVYQGIHRLRAGHALVVVDGRVSRHWRYWDPTAAAEPATPKRLRSLLESAVNLRMQADVPVGALLSGGVDSSAIVSIMCNLSSAPVRTYALGMDTGDEDLWRAREMARQLNVEHREYYFDPEEQWAIFADLLRQHGEPIMLLPLVHTFSLCRAIRSDGIKVVLSGNGADELFYGYTGHVRTLRISNWLDRLARMPRALRRCLRGRLAWAGADPGLRKSTYYRFVADGEWQPFINRDRRAGLANRAADEIALWASLCPSPRFIDESNFAGLMVENTHSVTTACDLPAMAASVEMRAPFLDQDMVSFALGVPVELKIPTMDPGWLKAILRDAVADLVPPALLRAPKRGFGSGIQEAALLMGPWRARAEKILTDIDDIDGLFDPGAVRKSWHRFLAGEKPRASQIARMLAIQVWRAGAQTTVGAVARRVAA